MRWHRWIQTPIIASYRLLLRRVSWVTPRPGGLLQAGQPTAPSPSQKQQENSIFLQEACHISASRKAQITISFHNVFLALPPPFPVNLNNKSLLHGLIYSVSACSSACLTPPISGEPQRSAQPPPAEPHSPAQPGQIPAITSTAKLGQTATGAPPAYHLWGKQRCPDPSCHCPAMRCAPNHCFHRRAGSQNVHSSGTDRESG